MPGHRYYTYSSTMGLCMEATARYTADTGRVLKMVVLDRPNPATGLIVDGPIADELGFTAYAPIPVAHGMTVGELARYFNAEQRTGCDLTVVPMKGWRRSMTWDDTHLAWVNPSPNLRSPAADLLYLGLGLLETSNVSVGRGTDTPFEVVGSPVDGWPASGCRAQRHRAAGAAVRADQLQAGFKQIRQGDVFWRAGRRRQSPRRSSPFAQA